MKRLLVLLLSLTLVFTMAPSVAMADDTPDYSGKTIVIYTANLRGDVDSYARLATAKADFEAKGAKVFLVDVGNYMQGTIYANNDRGESIFELMDAAGYDVAAMGAYEFVYGDATTGQKWHGNLYNYKKQTELKAAAGFKVISSNLENTGNANYAFDENAVLDGAGIKVGFVAQTDDAVFGMLSENTYKGGLTPKTEIKIPEEANITIGLSNIDDAIEGAKVTIATSTEDEPDIGAMVLTKSGESAEIDWIKDF
ncbi:MAG: hypothetical protein Q4A48_07460, partial [Bacillota bacterium]|nr:hypothetical protein [Bacillota bacterium]